MSAPDRLVAAAGFWLHNRFARRIRPRALPATQGGSLQDLRYRLRRDGLRRASVAECFAFYAAGLPQAPSAEVLAAAHALVRGCVIELAGMEERRLALLLAAFARALHGDPVHVLVAHHEIAKTLHAALAPRLSMLGIGVGCVARGAAATARRDAYACPVVIVPYREAAQDYLRDRAQAGKRRGALSSKLERVAAGHEALMPAELGCALVDEADLALLDEAQTPVAIATEIDQSRERLLYEQALELARSLVADDYAIGVDGIALSETARRRLERLVAPLGGVWSSRQRREELVSLALEALHLFRRDVDYRVQGAQVLFPPRPEAAKAAAGPDEELQKLVAVKEGCALATRREVQARLSLPRFFSRYRLLSGVCADARGLEGELWSLYGLKTSLAGARRSATPKQVRVFRSTEDKHVALVERVQTALAAGHAVTVAARRPAEVQALQSVLSAAGIQGGEALTVSLLTGAPPRAGNRRTLIVAELPEAARHVERLQRESGAAECTLMLSLDEEAVAKALGPLLAAARLAGRSRSELSPRFASMIGRYGQRRSERAARMARVELKAREQALDDLLAFSGQRE